MRMRRILLALTIVLPTAACSLFESEAIGISVLLEANPTVAVTGDTVTFVVNVAANNVSGVLITYGDSSASDQFVTGGVATARVTFKHAYADTGRYQARATVSDAVVGSRVVTQIIDVIPKPDTVQAARQK